MNPDNLNRNERKVVDYLQSQYLAHSVIWSSRPSIEKRCGVPAGSLPATLRRLVQFGVLEKKVLSDHGAVYKLTGLVARSPETVDLMLKLAVERDSRETGPRRKPIGVRGTDIRFLS